MKDFLKRNGIVVIAAAALVAIIAVVSITVGASGTDAASGTVNVVMRPVRGLMSSVVSHLEGVYGYIYRYDMLEAENAELKTRVAQLEREYREYSEIAEENERLRKLLDFTDSNEGYKTEPATVLSWSSSSWHSTFTIGKGTASGLSNGDCVINEAGAVIGRITSISPSSAVVTTLTDTTSSVSAVVWDTDDTAVLNGDFTLMKDGLVRLSYLPDGCTVAPGNTIMTSGRGGVFPRGLLLGTVESVYSESSGSGDWAIVRPSVELENLAYVYIITSFGEEAAAND